MNDKTRQMSSMQTTSSETGEQGDNRLSPEIQEHLGKQLRYVYGRFLSEPLPDKFGKLLDALSRDTAIKTEPKE